LHPLRLLFSSRNYYLAEVFDFRNYSDWILSKTTWKSACQRTNDQKSFRCYYI